MASMRGGRLWLRLAHPPRHHRMRVRREANERLARAIEALTRRRAESRALYALEGGHLSLGRSPVADVYALPAHDP